MHNNKEIQVFILSLKTNMKEYILEDSKENLPLIETP